eukprot:CAMPEP_0170235174 /NCGR_PEP_ID=MMETSP0116_2-20130129/17333_1 /TAXON_ID=400756 /ORGANISM="Durinskia baltica, Strain CSIRO CS-38" /LENGTH=152 /DNA_ID=CAMNT_0010485969 /DNA_START=91 /DNA_END=549 /DNA_ORIENTATION=-
MASSRMFVAAPCSGCSNPPKREPVYIERNGGRYKQNITFEFVGEGNGDFELEPEEEVKPKARTLRIAAFAIVGLAIIMLLVAFILAHGRGAGGVSGTNDTNATNGTFGTNSTHGGNSSNSSNSSSSKGTNSSNSSNSTGVSAFDEVPDWFSH